MADRRHLKAVAGSADFDTWQTTARRETRMDSEYDPTEYSLDQFYVRTTNRHDHSQQVNVRIPPDVYAMVMELVDPIPYYSSFQAFIRDAIVHRAHYLAHEAENLDVMEWLVLEMASAKNEMLEAETAMIEKLLTDTERLLAMWKKAGDEMRVKEQVAQAKFRASQIREPYASRLRVIAGEYED